MASRPHCPARPAWWTSVWLAPHFHVKSRRDMTRGTGGCHLLLGAHCAESHMSRNKGGGAALRRGSRRGRKQQKALTQRDGSEAGPCWAAVAICAIPPHGSGLSPAQRHPCSQGQAASVQGCSALLSWQPQSQDLNQLPPAPTGLTPQSLSGQGVGDGPPAAPAQWPGGCPLGRLPPVLTLLAWTPRPSSQCAQDEDTGRALLGASRTGRVTVP